MAANMKSTTITSPEDIRKHILYYGSIPTPTEFNDLRKGPITGALNRAIQNALGDNTPATRITFLRHLIIGYLTLPEGEPVQPVSSKRLTPQLWNGLSRWNSEQLRDGTFQTRPAFPDEVRWLIYRAEKCYLENNGQLPLEIPMSTPPQVIPVDEHEIPPDDHYDLPGFETFIDQQLRIRSGE